jgi:hypothetical protein
VPADFHGSRRTLFDFAVDIGVKFLTRDNEPSPDFAGFEVLRPDCLTDSPDSRTEIHRGLLDCEKTRNCGLGCYRIAAESCLLDWHIMPSKQCGSFLASTHVPASACRLAPHGAPPRVRGSSAEQTSPHVNSSYHENQRQSRLFKHRNLVTPADYLWAIAFMGQKIYGEKWG